MIFQKKIIKPIDYFIILTAIVLVIVSINMVFGDKRIGANVIISDPDEEWIYDLSNDQTFGVTGTIGVSRIAIKNGEAFFESSPCTNQICVMSNPIRHNAGFIACLPNQIFIRIEADEKENSSENTIDIIGY